MAILPASLAPRDTAATSNNSALHVAVIAPAAEEGMPPARASARASPASKSSIPCRQARSERTFSTSSYRNNGSSNSIQQAPYGHGLQPGGLDALAAQTIASCNFATLPVSSYTRSKI